MPQVDAPHTTPPARKRLSRRASWIGGLIAVTLLAGVGALAWYLTHPATDPVASAPRPGPGGGRGAPASTVGVATAERASVPVVLEALGTVTPQATVKGNRMPFGGLRAPADVDDIVAYLKTLQ